MVSVWSLPSFAQEKEHKAEEKFNPKDVIFEHIGDSHSWPVFGDVILPLPVILYTDKGLEVFSSANIREEEVNGKPEKKIYQGKYYSYTAEHDKVAVVDAAGKVNEEASKKILDFSITRNVASMWLGMAILLIVFLSMSSAYRKRSGKAPKGVQSVLEPLVMFVRDDVAIPNIGAKYQRFIPLLLTMFFFILINNLLGLVPFFPGGFNLTGNIAVTMVLALITLVVVNVSGNKYYWKHIFAPDIPLWLYIIMVPVEIIGIISKPFALMIRLFANITAGHIIALSLISLIFIFKTLWVSPASVLFVVFMDVIELLVAFLQAYIFTMLTALFIGMAVEEHHH
ncbi:F0F1 ATP synthase subunit A [Mucilaginibacter panaciglaebae]|uniref:ATP synthase subunit a n=2 Tax=Mucilaginibacter panaciglaebae TaxID=502331 RepID=A0ABP7WTB8_9SPHI